MTDFGTPEQADLIKEAIASALLDVHVCMPGIVQSYDDATRTCSVAPAVRRPVPVEDGTFVTEDLPVIQNVPVLVLGSPAISIEVELVKGDTVLLLFADYSFAGWRGNGQVSDPPDLRKHGPGYPIAIPWMRPSGGASADEKSTIGKAGGVRLHFKSGTIEVGNGTDFVAMAQKVDAAFSALANAFSSWVVTPMDGGAALKALLTSLAGSGWPQATAGSKLKSD
jgi:hypothetical protein